MSSVGLWMKIFGSSMVSTPTDHARHMADQTGHNIGESARSVNAQNQAQPAPLSTAGTTYTGYVIEGKPAVTLPDVNDLKPGRMHRLFFRGLETPSGQHWLLSVTVARGARPGKRVVLTSGVHGDEMSSIHTVQTVMSLLEPAAMSGTMMAVTDIARPALEGMQRR
jgi:hypothetical protein